MKDRIHQLMVDKGMTQRFFASELCIGEATLSGIFNGRTRPTTQTVNAIHECFPDVNMMWLMFGEGEMYVAVEGGEVPTEVRVEPSGAVEVEFDFSGAQGAGASTSVGGAQVVDANKSNPHGPMVSPAGLHSNALQSMVPQVQYIEKLVERPQRKITEIRIFFDDGTYEAFTP